MAHDIEPTEETRAPGMNGQQISIDMSVGCGFEMAFQTLTGHMPFPWQSALFDQFSRGLIPTCVSVPTGLGKTNIVAVWLIALAHGAEVPRRLVYVVNRRTVVDQTTAEVLRLRKNLPMLKSPSVNALAVSTLRGQFADNREWCADPSRPAVIVGTVDMIGSRLVFAGYGVGFKSRPLHAGFLGHDALIVHDEAHLEPAFQKLLEEINQEQKRERNRCGGFTQFHVMQLTATTRNDNRANPARWFTLTNDDRAHDIVGRRIKARKRLTLTSVVEDAQVGVKIAEIATRYRDKGSTVLVFVRTLEALGTIVKELKKTGQPVVSLTGTMRGKERDALVERPEFKRFFRGAEPGGTVYLVCTSAGEVGIDISADHMVCDISTFESMVQRLGRVNRYGERDDTRVDVVYPASLDGLQRKSGESKADEIAVRRARTLSLLRNLPVNKERGENGEPIYDASPAALMDLQQRNDLPCPVVDAFAPEPYIPSVTDVLFDAWALTSVRGKMPGRPPVEPYLHGIAEWQPPETHVAWREEVGVVIDELRQIYLPEDLLEDYPLKPHELLRDRSDRVFKALKKLAGRHADKPVWLVSDDGAVEVTTLKQLTEKRGKEDIQGRTILLPPIVGGLSEGMLDGASEKADDVADEVYDEEGRRLRLRVWDEEAVPEYLRLIRTIDMRPEAEETNEESLQRRFWHWYVRPHEATLTSPRPVTWDSHAKDVKGHAQRIVDALSLPREISEAVLLAAEWHDHGKNRESFQIMLGNRDYPNTVLAKCGSRGLRLPEPFRHEFASLLDAMKSQSLEGLDGDQRDLVLHLIAAHHGRARPHFEADEAYDPEASADDIKTLAVETPRRFARLQRRFGRWGLAYIESLLRAADWAASASPSAWLDQDQEEAKL